MNEVILVNLLNKICDQSHNLDWKMACSYTDGMSISIMQISFFDVQNERKFGYINFKMGNALVLGGRYKQLGTFQKDSLVLDALLDILWFETNTKLTSSC